MDTTASIAAETAAEEEPLVDVIQRKLEDVLSKENLADDTYLQQHINAHLYIPLTILASHNCLRALGDEATVLSTVKAAAERSEKVGLDETGLMVRPFVNARRNTLILRDLPSDFPEEELQALFASCPESDAFCSLRPDVNNTAFATFKSDEAAQTVALWLRSQKLQGMDIKCAVKSEHIVRSFFPASPGLSMTSGSPSLTSWGSPWIPVQYGVEYGSNNYDYDANYDAMNNMWWDGASDWMPDGSTTDAQGEVRKGKGSPKGKGKGRKRGSSSFSYPDMQMEMLPRAEMPQDAFASMSHPVGQASDVAAEAFVEPGYSHEYRKYSRQKIIDVCNAMEEILKPESYERLEQNDVALFQASPCKDWAPLPTPMAAFTANFFNEDRKGRESQDQDSGARPRKSSWGPKASRRSLSVDNHHEESHWGQGDSFWWKPGGRSRSKSKGRPSSRSWQHEGNSWDFTYSQSEGGYGTQHWVKKEVRAEQEDEESTDGPRPVTWVEKVKGIGEPKAEREGERESRHASRTRAASWVQKVKGVEAPQGEEEMNQECEKEGRSMSWAEKLKGTDDSKLESVSHRENGESSRKNSHAEPARRGEASKIEQENQPGDGDGTPPRKASWADKVKGVGSPAHRPQNGVAKAQPGEDTKRKDISMVKSKPAEDGKRKDSPASADSGLDSIAKPSVSDDAPAPLAEKTAKSPAPVAEAKSPGGPTWADRVRQAASMK